MGNNDHVKKCKRKSEWYEHGYKGLQGARVMKYLLYEPILVEISMDDFIILLINQ